MKSKEQKLDKEIKQLIWIWVQSLDIVQSFKGSLELYIINDKDFDKLKEKIIEKINKLKC